MDREKQHIPLLLDLFQAGLGAVSAAQSLPPHLPETAPKGRTLVLGAGKAAAAMAAVAAKHLTGQVSGLPISGLPISGLPISGLVVTRYGHTCDIPDETITVITAAHPVPDQCSKKAARHMLDLAQGCTLDDRLIFLTSGGGSSLLALPVPGLELAEKQDITRHLINAGANITQINCVRKHLSCIKGGRLAAASGTRDIHTLIISDVVGDEPSAIASGPTIADPTSLADARAVIAHYGCPFEEKVLAILHDKANETPKPGIFHEQHTVIAKATDMLNAAATFAQKKGWQVYNLGDGIEGEAREVGARHALVARELKSRGGKWLLLSGGETTVTVRNKNGCGGPNLEYLAGLAMALNGEPGITALACDSDGIDGSQDNAGAFVTPTTLTRAAKLGIELQEHLDTNRTYDVFKALDDLVITGPTLTNVNDFRVIAIET